MVQQQTQQGSQKAELKGKIIEFLWWMKKQGYKETTIRSRDKKLRRLVKLGANLLDPESVKEVIARQKNWTEAFKEEMVIAYNLFVKWSGLEWSPPRYKRQKSLPWIPTEREIDDLIAGCSSKHISTFLQIAKETAARAGEIFNLKWTDIDFENRTIRITPEKGSNPRIFKISNKLLAMLSSLPKKGEKVFGKGNYKAFYDNFRRQRNRVAEKLKNPRIKKISPLTLRHFKGTWEYHRTKDIIHVMKILGHKNIKNTMVYIQLEQALFKGETEYVCRVARTVKEAKKLIEAGFEFVCEIGGAKLFRKSK